MAYWILDMQAMKEVIELNVKVLEKEPRLVGEIEFAHSLDTERYVVFEFDDDTADMMEKRPSGRHGPFSSREEAETIAQRLNAACD